ncbi:ArsR/SmtB family transcription factor [Paramicrobacterium fandaimingii]|uniref:ArsR/SmtB family transcription factor n=1 Tax=Paramicrobacterium fandaimingii TaxID=2708079 RepID=UPI00141FB064|nr:metalloregulator ArsR/SmtB family transcription factor [Microbacterium fandaimingii]
MADIFDVIADGTRRDILRVLLDRHSPDDSGNTQGTSVSEIVAQLGLSQPTVSKHLKVLREAGLVEVREEGQHRYYSLDSEPLEAIEDWLIPFLNVDFTEQDLKREIEAHLPEQARQVADAIGHVAAGTRKRVSSAVTAMGKRFGRSGE